MKKIIQLFLLSALLLTAVSCGDSNNPAAETKDSPTTNAGTETAAADPLAFIPDDVFYEGKTFNVLQASGYDGYEGPYGFEVAYLKEDVVAGDIVSEAVWERNMCVYEKLGVTIVDIPGNAWYDLHNEVALSVQAGDNAYDAVDAAVNIAYKMIPMGLLYNLNEIESIDLSHPWWNQKLSEDMTFGDGIYTMTGDIAFYDDYSISCLFFNADLFNKYNLESPYQSVREGTWTFDRLFGIVKDFAEDMNGDGIMDKEDMYGIVTNAAFVGRMSAGLGERQIILDHENYPVLNQSERFFDAISMLVDDLANCQGYFTTGTDGTYSQIFIDSRALFSEDNLACIVSSRSKIDDTIGALPMPKFDEQQTEYYCPVNEQYCSVYAIPITSDAEMVGYVLEAMGAASVDTVTEAVIDKTCLVKSVRDEDSEEMIRLIMNSAAYPLASIVNWGNVYSILDNTGISKKNNYASSIEKAASRFEKAVEKDMNAILALQE